MNEKRIVNGSKKILFLPRKTAKSSSLPSTLENIEFKEHRKTEAITK